MRAESASNISPKELFVLQHAFPTLEFFRRLPGWKTQASKAGDPFTEPDWSCKTSWNEQSISINVWKINAGTIDIIIGTPQRTDTWTIKEESDYEQKRPYIYIELTSIVIPVYPLDPETKWVPVSGAQAESYFNHRVLKLYDISRRTLDCKENVIWNEKKLNTSSFANGGMSEFDRKNNSIYRSSMALRTIVLQAKPNTPQQT